MFKTISRILHSYNVHVANRPITQYFIRSSFQDLPRLQSLLYRRDRQETEQKTGLTQRATRKGYVDSRIAEHYRLTNQSINLESVQCLTFNMTEVLSTIDSGKLAQQQSNDSTQQMSTTTGTIQTTYSRHLHNRQTERNDGSKHADQSRSM